MTKKCCVIGDPISHSLSPKLFNFWIEKYGIEASYNTQLVTSEALKDSMNELVDKKFSGCNITSPLKKEAFLLMDLLDGSALHSRAINTVVIENGQKIGYNSDGFGFVESLKMQNPYHLVNKTVILGSGGAARGIAAALQNEGVKEFVFVCRNETKGYSLIRDLGLTGSSVVSWEDRSLALKGANLLINCTNLGMTDKEALNIDLTLLPKDATVCDIVYSPIVTDLLQNAQNRGNPIVEGLPMLLHQARLGFKLWFGIDPEVTYDLYKEMRK